MNISIYWLALSRMSGIGPIIAQRWLQYFENIEALFSASKKTLQEAGLTPRQVDLFDQVNWKEVEHDLVWLQEYKGSLICLTDENYPPLLRQLYDAPILLYVRGNPELLSQPQLAIVGSRNPTRSGYELAEQFASQLSAVGLVVTSGLALGVDAASHRGALSATGKTIAVMGTGLKYIYPASHRKLAEEILTVGALVSEFPLHTQPKAVNFPARNRLISGLSLGVLVVEAAVRSGSLITARCALEQNREVFAIPGSLHNPLARGCHQLIRQGARLVETTADILEELGQFQAGSTPLRSSQAGSGEVSLSPQLRQLYDQIGYEVTALDVIIMQSGLTSGEVSSMLLTLELDGYIQTVPGGYVRTSG